MFVFFNSVLDCMMMMMMLMMLVLMMCVHVCPMHADPPPPPPPPPTVWPSTFTFMGTVQNTRYTGHKGYGDHKGIVGEYRKTTVMCVI